MAVRKKPTRNAAQAVVSRILSPMEQFLATETSGGIILLVVTLVAVIWANSPWHELYADIIHTPISLTAGGLSLSNSLHHWVNDGLMVIFFFLVGLEIKRELVCGNLSSPKQAALPIIAAVGGMIVPAAIYTLFNLGHEGERGWGIPMATDIAFAIGALSLLSRKVPFALKVFLLALAIVDDLGAVLVIAFFYTSDISAMALGAAGVILGIIYLTKFAGFQRFAIYTFLGIIFWYFILQSGVHATIAGVVLGLMTPIGPIYDKVGFFKCYKPAYEGHCR